MTRALIAFLAFSLSLAAWQDDRTVRPIAVQRRLAFIVGNSSYPNAPLKNPGSDARDIAAALGRLGFNVTLKYDLGKKDFDRSFGEFTKQLRSSDLALFYFSGHGLQIQNENYLLPVDFHADAEADVEYEAFPASRVRKRLEEAGAAVRVLILDACRNNPYRFSRDTGGGLAAMTQAAQGTLIAFAAGDNQAADDNRGGRNGLYTTHLLATLEQPGISLKDVFEQTRARVWEASNKRQFPALYDQVVGRLILKDGGSPAVATLGSRSVEEDSWLEVRDSKRRDLLEAFIREFPNSPYVRLARIKISAMVPPSVDPPGVGLPKPDQTRIKEADDYYSKKQYAQSALLYRECAEAGNTHCMFVLGIHFQRGLGLTQDPAQAFTWVRKAALDGNIDAMASLGYYYKIALGVTADPSQSFAWSRKAAESGHIGAMVNLGGDYRDAVGVAQDYGQAMTWFRRAADGGNVSALGNIGHLYENGYGVARDREEAIKWYRKGAAKGDQYSKDALKRLGVTE